MSNLTLQTLIVAMVSTGIGFVIMVLARRGRLTFRYTMGWLALLGLGALSGLFLWASEPLSSAIGVTPGVVVLTAGVIALLVICIQLSISISGNQVHARRLAEEVALRGVVAEAPTHQKSVLAIVPALNEEQSIAGVVAGLVSIDLDVVVIDDGSTDRTADIAQQAGARVISMPYNTGVGGALRTGLLYAERMGYTSVVQCDGDGQHPPHNVQRLLDLSESEGSHILIGSRFASSDEVSMQVSLIRRTAMRVLARGASRAAGCNISDATSGFRVFRGSIISTLAHSMPDYYLGDTYETVISAGRAGYRIKEVPVSIVERVHGDSSATSLSAAQLAVRAFLASALRIHVRFPAPRD